MGDLLVLAPVLVILTCIGSVWFFAGFFSSVSGPARFTIGLLFCALSLFLTIGSVLTGDGPRTAQDLSWTIGFWTMSAIVWLPGYVFCYFLFAPPIKNSTTSNLAAPPDPLADREFKDDERLR